MMVTLLYPILASQLSLDSVVIAAAGYLIVFSALVLLFGFFYLLPRILSAGKIRLRRGKGMAGEATPGTSISGEETAAIALSLHLLMEELHDEESGVLTIKRISKTYSPWSSKIYAVRNQFNRM